MNATLGKSHLCTKQAVLRLGHGHIGTALGKGGEMSTDVFSEKSTKVLLYARREIFLSDPGVPGPIYGFESL